MLSDASVLIPDWPAPAGVRSLCTTRIGGTSEPPWDSFNLGTHVGDDPAAVAANRDALASWCRLTPERFGWLEQVHGVDVVELPVSGVPKADASFTAQRLQVCVIMTADCLPVLFCDLDGRKVAAAHAGWRGLCSGVLERTVARIGDPANVMAWLGPAIGPDHFEVGPEVRDAFLAFDRSAEAAFSAKGAKPGHFMADIYQLASQRLDRIGVYRQFGGGFCTMGEPERFYSYRRDGQTGRMASMIWLS